MPTARNHLSSAVVDGKLYAIGGRTSGPSGNLNANEAYDPSTNTWSTKAPMPTARGGLASVAINGNIYSFGGELLLLYLIQMKNMTHQQIPGQLRQVFPRLDTDLLE